MRQLDRLLFSAAFFGSAASGFAVSAPPALNVPPGFTITTYAEDVPNARQLAIGTRGTVFAGSREAGKVYAIAAGEGRTRGGKVGIVAAGLQMPSGVAFHDGDLYIGAVDRILVLRDIENHLDAPPTPAVITDRLPKDTHHGWKFLAFGADGRLYVAIGAPCNVCDKGQDYAKLVSMKADGSDWRDEAYGIRNTVGFDWQPGTGHLWFTDNGRDMLGEDLPSDELNRISRRGEHFGFPYCHQGDTPDPDFGRGKSCADYTAPVVKLGAHVAAIGMRFYTGSQFPADYRGAAIIAEHGSWNRAEKSGYRVVAVRLDGARVLGEQVLVDGFRNGNDVRGRPADVLVMPDGSMLVADDFGGRVYRLAYPASTGPTTAQPAAR